MILAHLGDSNKSKALTWMIFLLFPENQIGFILKLDKKYAQFILAMDIDFNSSHKNIKSNSCSRNIQEKCSFFL